jgi:hypothetical protein
VEAARLKSIPLSRLGNQVMELAVDGAGQDEA